MSEKNGTPINGAEGFFEEGSGRAGKSDQEIRGRDLAELTKVDAELPDPVEEVDPVVRAALADEGDPDGGQESSSPAEMDFLEMEDEESLLAHTPKTADREAGNETLEADGKKPNKSKAAKGKKAGKGSTLFRKRKKEKPGEEILKTEKPEGESPEGGAAEEKQKKNIKTIKKSKELKDKTVETVKMVQQEIEHDERKLKETSAATRRFLVGLALVSVLAVAVIFLFSDRFYNSVQGQSSYVLVDTETSVSYIEGNSMLLLHKGNMLRCSQDGLLALNASGGVVYDIPFTMSSPYAVSAGEYISVADRLGMLVILVKDGQVQTSIKPESTILLNTVNEQGEMAVVLAMSDGQMLNLYNASGEELMKRRTFSTTDGIPVSVSLSSDGSRMATSYVNYTGSVLQSVVTVFDLTETGSALVDRIVGSVIFEGEVVSDLQFMGKELFYAGTDSMGCITTETNVDKKWEKKLDYEIKTLARGEDFFAVWYGNGLAGTAQAAENNVVIYNYNGDVLYEMNVPNISYMDVWANTVVYASGREYYGINTTGKPKWSLNTGENFSNLVAYDNEKTVAATQNGNIRFFKVTLRGATINDDYGN